MIRVVAVILLVYFATAKPSDDNAILLQSAKNIVLALERAMDSLVHDLTNKPPSWIINLASTSDADIMVMEENGELFIASPQACEKIYKPSPGDVGLWYGTENDLWGYDKCGNLFRVTADGKKISLALECSLM